MSQRLPPIARPSALAATLLALGFSWQLSSADTSVELFDMPTRSMPLDEQDHQYLRFGEATFDYYSNRQFRAMSTVLVERERGLFHEGTTHSELLLGDLYVRYGLPDRAEEIFTRLLQQDILAQTRAETWYHTAALHYRQGEADRAAEILDSDRMDNLSEDLADQRHLMAANAHIHLENFDRAVEHLNRVRSGSVAAAYANYNMGVAMIRSGRVDSGLDILNGVINLARGDEEINALKDRAALTAGLTELQRGQPGEAREILSQVRSNGPFSNEAMMTMGLANYYRGESRQALPLWLELVRRNPGHESVQEALMLAPQAYEELGAKPQALAGYRFAAERYREELRKVEVAIRNIDRPEWVESLLPEEGAEVVNQDPMALLGSLGLAQGEEMDYLHQLFASHTFAERFRQYQQVLRLQRILRQRHKEIPALREIHAHRQSRLREALPTVRAELVDLKSRRRGLRDAALELEQQIPARLDMSRPQDLAALPQLIMWQRVNRLEEQASRRGISGRDQERLRRVRGLLLWDIAHDAEETREQQEEDSRRLVRDTGIAEMRVAALEELVREGTLALREEDNGLREELAALESEVESQLDSARTTLEQLEQILKNDALRVLAEIRRSLGEQLGEVHLAMARIQEGRVLEDATGLGEALDVQTSEGVEP